MTTTTQNNVQNNTPTKRLSDTDIYNDIYNMVKHQVKEMLTRGGTNEFNWNNGTTYTRDILNNGMTHGWLVALWNGDKDEFADCVNNCGIDQDLANEMIANFSTYLGMYWRFHKMMIKDAGFTQEVYVQRRERAKLAKLNAIVWNRSE